MKARILNPEHLLAADADLHRATCACRGALDVCSANNGRTAAEKQEAAA